ncbi:MAG TPA: universal stress protein [Polyangiaceae bacterium]|nr:universal stress protein [Polyangiaceae bacterium]
MLVALDGSPRERDVLGAAIAIGQRTSAKLVLFRSVGVPRELPHEAFSVSPDEIPRLLEARAASALAVLENDVPVELRGGARVVVGTAWQSIERIADEEDVDLIVIGSHGYGTLDRVVGTTAAKIVNHADRSVLVVRAPERLART